MSKTEPDYLARKVGQERADEIRELGGNLVNWHGHLFLTGPGNTLFFHNEIAQRRNKNMSNIILISGSPGSGKTWTGLQLCETFDKNFDPDVGVAFSQEEVLNLLGSKSPIKRGGCILIDEAHFSAGARNWYEVVQKSIMNSVAAIRSRNFIIFIVALHRNMLDNIIRQYVLKYQIHLEGRGKSVVYELSTPRFETKSYRKRRGSMELPIPNIEKCSNPDCLECPYMHPENSSLECQVPRARYERRKQKFLDLMAAGAEMLASNEARKAMIPPEEQLMPLIYEKRAMLAFTNRGTLDSTSIQDIVYSLGYSIGHVKAGNLGKRVLRMYPDLRTPQPD